MLPVYAPISAASRSGTRRRGGDVVRSTSKVYVLTRRKRSARPTGSLAWTARWKEKVVDTWGADLDPDLKTACDVEFSLAYGGKLLLHNTRLFLKCGRRYGICGKNGVGKTTLMRNVDNGKIEGLDPDLCSVFVESHADEDPDDAKPVNAA